MAREAERAQQRADEAAATLAKQDAEDEARYAAALARELAELDAAALKREQGLER